MLKIKHYSAMVLALIIGMYACQSGKDSLDENLVEEPYRLSFGPYPPKDLPSSNATQDELIRFAWNEFIALNWKSSFTKNRKRDMPDTSWNWHQDTTVPYPDLLVWETYAHRSELRPYNDTMKPFDDKPHYSYGASLKQGTTDNGGMANFGLFNNLDEDNEIGSCNLYAHVDKYKKDIMVLYQAKVNRDEYDYIRENYPTKAKLLQATTNTFNNINKYDAYYQGAKSTCNCPDDVLCLPCGNSPVPGNPGQTYQGAMEIKTAWRRLTAEDDPSKFFVRDAIYYDEKEGGGYYNNGKFALIGLHIIHKTTNYPDFIFATWEHVEVTKDNMGYVLLDSNGKEKGGIVANYPRQHPIPDDVEAFTVAVWEQMGAMNPNSIWLNYRMVGVQGKATSDSSAFNFFLANYVIESDSTLADFHGRGISHPHDYGSNILLDGKRYSMGGCKGCHGVAQLTLGTDLSFLLDTVGKPIFKPDVLQSADENTKSKLQRYIDATSKGQKK